MRPGCSGASTPSSPDCATPRKETRLPSRGANRAAPDRARETLLNAFVQDEIGLAGNRISVTLGAKLENDTFAGTSWQPTARVRWNVTPNQRIWAGVSLLVALFVGGLVSTRIGATFDGSTGARIRTSPSGTSSPVGTPISRSRCRGSARPAPPY